PTRRSDVPLGADRAPESRSQAPTGPRRTAGPMNRSRGRKRAAEQLQASQKRDVVLRASTLRALLRVLCVRLAVSVSRRSFLDGFRVDAEVLELAVEVGALHLGQARDLGDVAAGAREVVLEIGLL